MKRAVTSQAAAIEGALEVIEVDPEGGFWWLGERADWYPSKLVAGLSVAELNDLTLSALTQCLYENFYMVGGPQPLPIGHSDGPPDSDPIPRHRLARANTGSGSWQSGWEILDTDGRGRVRVRRDGLTLIAQPDEVRRDGGAWASIRRPKDMYALSPGFHTANLDAARDASASTVRLYWHVGAAGAEEFIRSVTRECNEAGIGGSLKVLNDRSRFGRCDSAVVYLSTDDVARRHDVIASIHEQLTPYLFPETPAMTLKLAAGLALAEDPGGILSFGQHRCRLIAQAAMSKEQPTEGFSERPRLEEVFATERLSLDEPYCSWESRPAFAGIAARWS